MFLTGRWRLENLSEKIYDLTGELNNVISFWNLATQTVLINKIRILMFKSVMISFYERVGRVKCIWLKTVYNNDCDTWI